MNISTKDIYSEIYSVLNLLGKSYIEKLPKDLMDMIDEERNKEYNPEYTLSKDLDKQNINKKSLSVIALLHTNYWSDKEEKENLQKIFKLNEEKYQKELREKYNPDDVLKIKNKSEKIEQAEDEKQDKNITEYKESIFEKIINFIKRFFKK